MTEEAMTSLTECDAYSDMRHIRLMLTLWVKYNY